MENNTANKPVDLDLLCERYNQYIGHWAMFQKTIQRTEEWKIYKQINFS